MAMSTFLAKLVWWIVTCLISLMIGANTANCFYTFRKDHKVEFKNQVLKARLRVNKDLTDTQAGYIKQLKHENAKLKQTKSK